MISFYIIFLTFAFLLGAVIGSFLNVCIYRIPAGESIVSPPSRCPGCGSPIKFYDNVPILSYIILLGRCRRCGKRISLRYPMIEMLTGLISSLLMLYYGPTISYLIYLLLSSSLIVITFIDLDHRIIPAIPIGFACSFILPQIYWLDSLIGILAGGGSLLLVAMAYEALTGHEGMGGGDIKLLAMLGAFLGWKGVLFTIMASSLTGTVVGGLFMLLSGKGRKFQVPFGPFLAAGAMLYILWGDELIYAYLRLISR